VTFRRSLLLGAASAVGACSLLLSPMAAMAASSSSTTNPPVGTHTDSLRDLGARVGLRVGTAVNPTELNSSTYKSLIADQFSTVTPENEMKWETVEPTRGQYNWAPADKLVAFAEQNHQLVRGHTLVWGNQLPSWLTTGVANGTIGKPELRDILKKHITDEVSHFKGKIWQWDVVNEAFSDGSNSTPSKYWVQQLGVGILADAFRWAHAADPKALLFYNDYAIEDVNSKSTAILNWMKGLKADGVPIDGIGFQTHLDTQYGVPGDFTQDMQRFADAGFKVAVTEADVRTFVQPGTNTPVSADAQAKENANWKQTIDSCLAVRACISYTVWGVSDNQSWVPGTFHGEGSALLWDEQLQPKPQYTVVQHELATTDAVHRTGEGAGRS
jgi:endo-1,4-beta-xylanase